MSQVSGPVIAVGLVLSAVFVPCAFISGITGQFFRQFALTIAVSTVISAFNSLTLSPALSALLLRPQGGRGSTTRCCRSPAYPLLGGWLGYRFLTPAGPRGSAAALGRPGWNPSLAGVALGSRWPSAAVGGHWPGVFARPLNRVLGWLLPAVQRRLQLLHQRLHPPGRHVACG